MLGACICDTISKPVFKDLDNRHLVIFIWLMTIVFSIMTIATWTVIHPTVLNVASFSTAVALFVVSTRFIDYKSGLSLNLFRWQNALWFGSLCWMVQGIGMFIRPEPTARPLIIPAIFFLLAVYDYVQSRRPNGKHLNLPKSFVHGYSRLGWKWLTNPKRDYWLCYAGLPIPILLTGYLVVRLWNEGNSNAFLILLKLAWIFALAVFTLFWLKAPTKITNNKELIGSGSLARGTAITYVIWVVIENKTLYTIGAIMILMAITGVIETGYDRTVQRMTPAGNADYEALEGPSLGL